MVSIQSKDVSLSPPKLSIFRLVRDQARVTPDVLTYAYEGSGTVDDPYLVMWISNDAGNPLNWSRPLKCTITLTVAVSCFATNFASSAYYGTFRQLVHGLDTPVETIAGGLSLFVLGFALGPLVWAPLSETIGRQYVFCSTFAAFILFLAGCAGVDNVGALLVLRFFAGSFGSSPFTNAGGIISDMFASNERGLANTLFSLAPGLGPGIGSLAGGFLGEAAGWRWVQGLLAIFAAVTWIVETLVVPETYAPVSLRRRAEKLSKMTGLVYKTKFDVERGPVSTKQMVSTVLVRPWVLLFTEPIVFLLSIYIAIIFGTLYLLFAAYPIVFQVHRGWSAGTGSLAFLGVTVGMFLAIGFSIYAHVWHLAAAAKNGGRAPPEAHLVIGMVGSIALPISMFWFAWTTDPPIHWIFPIAAGAPFGFGLTLVSLSVTSYLIEAYTIYAASVLAANTVLRSLVCAAFPLFTGHMYEHLGIHWASSVPAFMSLACVPLPFVFWKYGAAIRRRCVYAILSERAGEALCVKADAVAASAEKAGDSSGSDTDTDTDTDVEKCEKEEQQIIKVTDPLDLARTSTTTTDTAVDEVSLYDIDCASNNKSSISVVDK